MIPDDPTRFDGDPTPQEIADRAAEIQVGWTDEERARRATFLAGKWRPSRADYQPDVETPVIAQADLDSPTD